MARKAPVSDASTVRRSLVEGQVLDHAAELFADKGFGATSLEDIARSVGMKQPSLYHYFRSKDEILAQIVADGMASGHFRAVDPRFAALAVLGMCNWTAFWFVPGSRDPVEPLADAIAAMAVRSVAVAPNAVAHGGDPRVMVAALRENLDVLTALGDERPVR